MATTYTELLQLPKHDPKDFCDVTLFNEMADKIDAAMAKAYRGKAAHNLLINSDFRNPVNQRGETSYSGSVYMIDCWKGSAADLTVNDGSISVSRGSRDYAIFAQFTPSVQLGKTYTLAAENAAGEIILLVYTPEENMSNKARNFSTAGHNIIARYSSSSNMFYIGAASTVDTTLDLVWMALYEGSYTLDTLPDYVPNENELAKSKEYAVRTRGHGWGYTVNSTTIRLNVPVPTTLRIAPSIPAGLTFTVIVDGSAKTVTEYSVNTMDNGVVRLTLTGTGFPTARTPVVGYANKEFVLSSDL